MTKDDVPSYIVGFLGFLIYFVLLLNGLWGLAASVIMAPIFYLFPSLKDLGIAGMFIFGPVIILSIFIYPYVLFLIAKKLGYQVKIGGVIIGFLLAIVFGNIINLVFFK